MCINVHVPTIHTHVRSGTDNFSITIQDRVIEGKARSKTVKIINDFIDEHEAELMELWGQGTTRRENNQNKIRRTEYVTDDY